MNLNNHIACICEGAAEHAIMDLLLTNDKLIFSKEKLLEEEIIRCRSAKKFEERYLKKEYSEKITLFRILDSHNETFKLSKLYQDKVDVINIVTAPEIEMLIILAEKNYSKFEKSKKKPNEFCKTVLKYKDVKSYHFITNYFANIDKLIKAICEYKRISKIQKNEFTIADLINPNVLSHS